MKKVGNIIDFKDEATLVFGDIVETAFMNIPSWHKWTKEDDIEVSLGNWNNSIEEGIHPKDAFPVYVKFLNGKEFQIWCSEWGGVTSITLEDYLKG